MAAAKAAVIAHSVRPVPAQGRIDWQQLRTLLWIYYVMSFRSSIDASTGKVKDRPAKLFLSLTFLSLFFLNNAHIMSDMPSYQLLLFFTAFGITTSSLLPNTHEVRQRFVEILHTKPISLTDRK